MGKTQASSVIPVVRLSEAESLTVTRAFEPLKERALPNLPALVLVALSTVPVFPVPEESVVVAPEPSLNPYAATSPGAEIAGDDEGSQAAKNTPASAARIQPV